MRSCASMSIGWMLTALVRATNCIILRCVALTVSHCNRQQTPTSTRIHKYVWMYDVYACVCVCARARVCYGKATMLWCILKGSVQRADNIMITPAYKNRYAYGHGCEYKTHLFSAQPKHSSSQPFYPIFHCWSHCQSATGPHVRRTFTLMESGRKCSIERQTRNCYHQNAWKLT